MYPTIRDQGMGNKYRCVYRAGRYELSHKTETSYVSSGIYSNVRGYGELTIVGGRAIVMAWAKKWTGVLKEVDLNIL